ncbi:EXS family-domain-containing protein [Gymnopilus junonius]|uniref:EXS family-domain-containing protein n=1 Tax=Gymnopilus junonius TaxID=109634 RepID=A0A9P5TP17_GYMJU|nr:EXS family-domain-containing protein [Gymnopilus junonius]
MTITDNDEIQYHLSFPLPYRTLFLVGLGILGWATNLHGLDALGVDVVATMELRTEHSHSKMLISMHNSAVLNHSKAIELYHSSYRIFFDFSTFCFLSWLLYRMVTHGNLSLVDAYGYIPVITAIVVILILLCPYNIFMKVEREKFIGAIWRCVFPPSSGPIYFSDVVFADIGTSFAKVFGDVWLSLWMLKPGNSILFPPIQDGLLYWIFPTIMSFPFFLRLRQCIIEYYWEPSHTRRPLFNALKYATSFPVIFLSAAQRIVVTDLMKEKGSTIKGEAWHGEHPLFRLWLLAAVINSLYSFWWDVTNDWGLDLLRFDSHKSVERQVPKPLLLSRMHSDPPLPEQIHPASFLGEHSKHRHRQSCYGLRAVLLYPRAIYPIIIFLNLLLRMTWSIKLSTHMHSFQDGSVAFFWLEVAELVRRWLWVFVRVEWEVIKKAREGVPTITLDERSGDESEYEFPTLPDMRTGA